MMHSLFVQIRSVAWSGAARAAGSSWSWLAGAALVSCASLQPVSASTRVEERPARELVLELSQPCTMSPSGAPMGRPNTAGAHRRILPAGRYTPAFADGSGVYFASPTGVVVATDVPSATRARAGGIYLRSEEGLAFAYLGDPGGVSERERLPKHCEYSVQGAKPPQPSG